MRRTLFQTLAVGLLAGVAGCDYSGEWFFAQQLEDVPDVWVLTAEDGGLLVPADIANQDDLLAATIYAETGASATTELGGVTFDFVGTGGDVCVWVDPELTTWNQAVSERPVSDVGAKFSYPDNIYDDGDLDLYVGQSVYYTGSPGERIGDFVVLYEDSLGNKVPISLSECAQIGLFEDVTDAHAGRGYPESCTINASQEGISYTVLLQTWSTPLDDDRLGFGVVLANGSCDDLRTLAGVNDDFQEECLVQGESIMPNEGDHGPWYGFDAIQPWPGSIDYEAAFCDIDQKMKPFCNDEAKALEEDGLDCSWETVESADTRCFCGDPTESPDGGAF